MPKNTQGGKNYKKQKHKTDQQSDKPLLEKTEGQEYAYVVKLLGNSKIMATFYDIILKKERDIMGMLRPGLKKKRQFARMGSIILISLREFETTKADVIYVYTDEEVDRMKRKNILNDNIIKNETNDEFKFEDQNYNSDDEEQKKIKPKKIKNKNNITVQDFGMSSDDTGSDTGEVIVDDTGEVIVDDTEEVIVDEL